ncbi:hypothetical protein [Laspinema olomoucense]|uniref:hypothetical protein n=1 Tax=Laspinema olomoucense TaxID=3231600 RepID=UPI0021BAE2AF|nr:hypothetical protein [Laspinema sp. D3d]MCT7973381.1 hypothetical protein [Laspinema sp. D3d]
MELNLLKNYPEWQERIHQARQSAPLPVDYSAQVIEIFDQHGLLAGSIFGVPYQQVRTPHQITDFLAWVVDGELVVVISNGQILLNRVQGQQLLISFVDKNI